MKKIQGGKISTLDKKYKTFHIIFDEPISNKSYSSYLLLKEEYKLQDEDYLEHEYYKKRFKKGIKGEYERFKSVIFSRNINFYGVLTCVVCKNNNLVKPVNKKKITQLDNTATLEHIENISEGGYKYATKMIECTCYKCNNERGTLPIYKIGKHDFIF